MNLVEKVLDGVQNFMNVNSATFSGAVDIIVVPQEDGSLACTSWHVRFGKLQLINTSEKKVCSPKLNEAHFRLFFVATFLGLFYCWFSDLLASHFNLSLSFSAKIQIEVNDVPIKGMKMRLGRAGEGYFVAETSEPPPPEFRASIDPEHGLSDDESYNLEPRATHDDWAEQDEQQARVVDMMVEPPADGNWGDPSAYTIEERSHIRLRSGPSSSSAAPSASSDNGDHQRLRSSASAQSVLSHPSGVLTSSGEITPTKALQKSGGGRENDFDRRSDDGRPNASAISDLDPYASDSGSHEQLTSSDPIIFAPTASRTNDHAISVSSKKHTASNSKPAGKGWGLSLFGFLGKKEPQEQQPQMLEDDEEETLVRATGGATGIGNGRRTSVDWSETGSRPVSIAVDDQSSFSAAASNSDAASRHIQSSSLPNNWGPSPLQNYGAASTENEEIEEKSRPAEDGSGVIYLGQKRKNRSSSITSSSSMGNTRLGADSSAANTKSKSGTQTPNIPTSMSPTPVSMPSPSPTLTSGSFGNAESLTSGGNRSKNESSLNTSSNVQRDRLQVSSPDSDEEYQDMVFEMDEEAYAAANPGIGSSSATSPLFGVTSTSPVNQGGVASANASTSAHGSNASSGPSPILSPSNATSNAHNSSLVTSSAHGSSNAPGGDAGAVVPTSDGSSGSQSRSQKPLLEASRCGMSAVACADSDPYAALEAFNSCRLTYAAMNEDPSLIFGPEIVFRINNAYYPLQTAAPMLFSVALFNEALSAPAIDRLMHQQLLRAKQVSSQQKDGSSSASGGSLGKAWGRLWQWGRNDEKSSSSTSTIQAPTPSKSDRSATASPPIGRAAHDRGANARNVDGDGSYVNATVSGHTTMSPKPHRARSASKGPTSVRVAGLTKDGNNNQGQDVDFSTGPQSLFSGAQDAADGVPGAGAGSSHHQINTSASQSKATASTSSSSASASGSAQTGSSHAHGGPYYVRTLKPTSDKLKALNLKPGANKIVFRVNSRLQGDKQLSSTVFLWDREAKVVISDIDGTITKSDVLGQIFPVFGKDWSHMGVAQLFQSIKANGYEILYLTARAIGAAAITKGFLTTLQQGTIKLPVRAPITY